MATFCTPCTAWIVTVPITLFRGEMCDGANTIWGRSSIYATILEWYAVDGVFYSMCLYAFCIRSFGFFSFLFFFLHQLHRVSTHTWIIYIPNEFYPFQNLDEAAQSNWCFKFYRIFIAIQQFFLKTIWALFVSFFRCVS